MRNNYYRVSHNRADASLDCLCLDVAELWPLVTCARRSVLTFVQLRGQRLCITYFAWLWLDRQQHCLRFEKSTVGSVGHASALGRCGFPFQSHSVMAFLKIHWIFTSTLTCLVPCFVTWRCLLYVVEGLLFTCSMHSCCQLQNFISFRFVRHSMSERGLCIVCSLCC